MSEDRLDVLRNKIENLTSSRARAQVESENASQRREEILTTLKEDYGITSAADIGSVRAELKADVEARIQEIEDALKEAGAL